MNTIRIEVVYVLADRQWAEALDVEPGTTVQTAIDRSGLMAEFPDLDLGGRNKIGIWNKLAKLDTLLRDRDRIEIYRPLIADPKEVRRQRAAEGKAMKKGGGAAEED